MHRVLFNLSGMNRLKRPQPNIERQLANFHSALVNSLENLRREVQPRGRRRNRPARFAKTV